MNVHPGAPAAQPSTRPVAGDVARAGRHALPLLRAPVRHDAGAGRRRPPRSDGARLPHQPRRALPQGLDRGGPARFARAADGAADPRPQGRRPARSLLGRGARPRGGAARRRPGAARRRRGRRLRRRRPDQREGLPAGQVRPRGARHRQHRLQRPLLHVVGRGGRHPCLRHRPRPALPDRRYRRHRGRAGRGQQSRRDDAAAHAVFRRAARPRRPADRRRPAPQRHRQARHAAPADDARAATPRWRRASSTSRSATG